ncbi:hypothetical protein QBC35DRAFT_551986 [Podospora australis]|uniref:Uncharacterized protein n=1 Tax=Podospora australis TaxID=1536484 RepID=A0AAN6WUD7_9PEZI|nr:hypothetical protein QBC35DRAFT_551986 [Podospora australis]
MTRAILLPFALVAALAGSLVSADRKPEIKCPGGLTNLVNGFDTRCDVASIDGLQGRPASQLLYEIIMEAPLPNSTFFANNNHVTCLYGGASFGLSGAGLGVGPVSFTIPPIKYGGALCLYVTKVPQGGLDLGQIRNLTRTYILKDGCDKCGFITANFFSRNVTQEGFVRLDWRDNANCIEGCIDPAKDLVPEPATSNNTNGTGAEDKKNSGETLRSNWAQLGSLLLLSAMVLVY